MSRPSVKSIARHLAALTAGPAADVPDADLLRRYAAGRDGEAFAELVRRHGPMVWAACRHLLPNPADAEDAFQAAFLALARSAARLRPADAVGGWLHGVAVRAAANVRRADARRRRRERAAAGLEAGRPVPDSAWGGLLAAVHEEVEGLPAALRTAFVLCDLEGVPQPAAATRLGWKPGTLTGRLSKARQRLLDRLTKRGVAPSAGVALAGATAGAVPAGLSRKALMMAVDPLGASAAVSGLATEVTAMTFHKAKVLAAGLMVAGGLGLGAGAGRLSSLTAQTPDVATEVQQLADPTPPPAPSPPQPAAAPAALRTVPDGPGWEYRLSPVRGWSVARMSALLTESGAAGWEYTGELPGEAGTMVFKRPRPARGLTAAAPALKAAFTGEAASAPAPSPLARQGRATAQAPAGGAAPGPAGRQQSAGRPVPVTQAGDAPEPLILPVAHIPLADAAQTVHQYLESLRLDAVVVSQIERTNTLVLFNLPPAAASRVADLLKKLDTPPAAGRALGTVIPPTVLSAPTLDTPFDGNVVPPRVPAAREAQPDDAAPNTLAPPTRKARSPRPPAQVPPQKPFDE